MFVSIHCGENFLSNAYEIYYSKEVMNSFMVDDDTSIWDLQSMIYECTGYDTGRYNLELATRLSSGIGSPFIRMPIIGEAAWRGLYGQLKANEIMVMEIYVKRVARESGVGISGQNLIAPNYEIQPEPYTPVTSCADVHPQSYIHVSPPTIQPPPHTKIPPRFVHVSHVPVAPLSLPEAPPYLRAIPVDDENRSNFENIDVSPKEDLQTGDEFEGEN